MHKERTSTPVERETSEAKQQIENADERVFGEVFQAYGKCCQLLDRCEQTGRWTKRTAEAADFAEEVESATDFALQGTSLIDDWFCLVEGVQLQPEIMELIIWLCAPEYRKRGLHPGCYFAKDSVCSGTVAAPLPTVFAGWYGVPSKTSKDSIRNYSSHHRYGVLEKNTHVLCKEHGPQTVTDYFKNPDGNIMRLACGCNRREDIAAAAPARGSVVSMTTPPAAASHSTGHGASMLQWHGTAA